VFEAAAYLRAQGTFFALNHPFFFFRGQMPIDRYLEAIADLCPGIEARNGTMLREHNELTEAIVERWGAIGRARLATTGGSDAHTLRGIGTTYTEAPGATREEFLESLRAGRARVGGRHGSAWREAREIYGVVGRYWMNLAGLAGRGGVDLPLGTRAIGVAFSAVSLPFEFFPLLVAIRHKRHESRMVTDVATAGSK
jgi:hypothetical protein